MTQCFLFHFSYLQDNFGAVYMQARGHTQAQNAQNQYLNNKGRGEVVLNGKREQKQREGKKKTLITETLTHKAGDADTSGNQRNVSQLWDTSIHPALSAALLLKAMGEMDWGGGW